MPKNNKCCCTGCIKQALHEEAVEAYHAEVREFWEKERARYVEEHKREKNREWLAALQEMGD